MEKIVQKGMKQAFHVHESKLSNFNAKSKGCTTTVKNALKQNTINLHDLSVWAQK
jgi:hypothetical protein